MLIEKFCQKLIVSNVILAFLDHLKPKIYYFDIIDIKYFEASYLLK